MFGAGSKNQRAEEVESKNNLPIIKKSIFSLGILSEENISILQHYLRIGYH